MMNPTMRMMNYTITEKMRRFVVVLLMRPTLSFYSPRNSGKRCHFLDTSVFLFSNLQGFQDTSQYVEHEIAVLEEDRVALDRVAVKLEKELREAMNTEGWCRVVYVLC
jgi:hypothetical protein